MVGDNIKRPALRDKVKAIISCLSVVDISNKIPVVEWNPEQYPEAALLTWDAGDFIFDLEIDDTKEGVELFFRNRVNKTHLGGEVTFSGS